MTLKLKTYTEFRRRVDEFQLDLLQIPACGVDHEGFTDCDDTLLGTGDRAFQHEEVVLDDTIVGEATHGCDRLLGDVRFGGSISCICAETNAVNLLVEFRTVMVAI
jgi:hypothetical protein